MNDDLIEQVTSLSKEVENLTKNYKTRLEEKDQILDKLNTSILKSNELNQRLENALDKAEKTLAEKDELIESLAKLLKENKEAFEHISKMCDSVEARIDIITDSLKQAETDRSIVNAFIEEKAKIEKDLKAISGSCKLNQSAAKQFIKTADELKVDLERIQNSDVYKFMNNLDETKKSIATYVIRNVVCEGMLSDSKLKWKR